MIREILKEENILLGETISSKEDAIKLAGNILVENNYVKEEYIQEMLKREIMTTTYMGNFIAIPHGTEESKGTVIKSGISIIQVPKGVDFGGGNIAKVIFGIAGKNNEHLDILSQIAIFCSEVENVEKIIRSNSKTEIIEMLKEVV